MFKLNLDRYKPNECIDKLRKEEYRVDGDEGIIGFTLDEEDFEIYFIPSNKFEANWQMVGEDVLKNISFFDNLVQKSCAEESSKSDLSPQNYELYLAYMKIFENSVELCYYGLHVNTEWDAIFKKTENGWEKSNF